MLQIPCVEQRSNYIPTLDGWRAIAVIAVIGIHGTPENIKWLSFFSYGDHGVNIFFGISGYLICSRLLDEEEKYANISLKKFYLRRAFRILPPAYFYILVINLMGIFGLMTLPSFSETLASLFFFRNYLPVNWSRSYTGHFWSLAVEEHFYLFWPALLIWVGSTRMRKLIPYLALSIPLWRFVKLRLHLAIIPDSLYYQHTDWVIDGLLWGCAMALLMRDENWRRKFLEIITFPVWLLLLAIFILVCVYPLPLRAMFEAIVIPMLLIGTIQHPKWFVSKVLEFQPMRWIGRISYSLYIWQSVLFVSRTRIPTGLQIFPLNIVVLLAIACFSYYCIERPLIKRGHQYSSL